VAPTVRAQTFSYNALLGNDMEINRKDIQHIKLHYITEGSLTKMA